MLFLTHAMNLLYISETVETCDHKHNSDNRNALSTQGYDCKHETVDALTFFFNVAYCSSHLAALAAVWAPSAVARASCMEDTKEV